MGVKGPPSSLPPPHNQPAALLPEAGAQGEGVQCFQGPGRPQLGEHADHPPTFCAGLARVQLSSPQALTTQEKPTQREREAEQAEPLGLREPGGGHRGREGRSWGGGGADVTDSTWGHRHAPTLPRSPGASLWLRLSGQHPPPDPGAQEPGAPCLLPGGRAHLREEGARLECAQLQGKSSVSRACLGCVCVCGGGVPHTHCPLPVVGPCTHP